MEPLTHQDGTEPDEIRPRMTDHAAEQSARMGGYANIPTARLCAQLFSSERTVQYWKKKDRVPRLVRFALDLLYDGKLGLIADAFEGWAIRRGYLHAPNGWTFTADELLAIPLRHQEIAALRREIRLLTEQLARSSPLSKASCLRTRRKTLTTPNRHDLLRSLREDEHAPRG